MRSARPGTDRNELEPGLLRSRGTTRRCKSRDGAEAGASGCTGAAFASRCDWSFSLSVCARNAISFQGWSRNSLGSRFERVYTGPTYCHAGPRRRGAATANGNQTAGIGPPAESSQSPYGIFHVPSGLWHPDKVGMEPHESSHYSPASCTAPIINILSERGSAE